MLYFSILVARACLRVMFHLHIHLQKFKCFAITYHDIIIFHLTKLYKKNLYKNRCPGTKMSKHLLFSS